MCLMKLEARARVSTAPLKVYKFLLEDNTSPFRQQKYHRGLNVPDAEETDSGDHRFITDGYLHAYVERGMAEFYAMAYQELKATAVKVVEMYIPEDTIYWTGFNSDVAAKKLYWPED